MFRKHKLGMFGLQSRCIECECLYQKNNSHLSRKRTARYRNAHPKRAKLQSIDNKRRLLERNPEYFRSWQLNNKDKCRAAERRYAKNNPEMITLKAARRRAKKKSQTANLSSEEKQMVKLIYEKSRMLGSGFVVDHVVPISKGGSDHPYNLQIITSEENNRKSNYTGYEVKGLRIYWKDNSLIEEVT